MSRGAVDVGQKLGSVEVICGSMFSGKSEELIRRVRRAGIARQRIAVFKPALDNRYSDNNVVSHDGIAVEAIPVATSSDIRRILAERGEVDVVAIDEAQFFDTGIVGLCEELADCGSRVIVAGLDQDFRGEPFGVMPELLARAEEVTKLRAICVRCGRPASRTQRLIDGRPASYDDPVIMVGAEEAYEARCRACHEVAGLPGRRR